jgi:hypothetical protein
MKKLSVFASSRLLTFSLATTVISLISAHRATAATIDLSFTKLSGLTGGNSLTSVYRANLSGIGFDISSIMISDNNSGIGGSAGRFSGFDLDAIKLSNTAINNAADINSLSGLKVFDFSSAGTMATLGTQRTPADLALFGTTNGNIDNSVATLQNFDGNAVTNSNAFGYASLGDGGKVGFNLTSLVSTTNPLYLYIGEVGDNGEVANGQVIVSGKPVAVPEPTTLSSSLAALPLIGIYSIVCRRKRRKAA